MARESRWSRSLFLRKNTPTTIALPPGKPLLLTLPNELLIIIALELAPKDLNSLLRTNRRLANLLKSSLYDVAFRKEPRGHRAASALCRAAKMGHEDVVKLILDRGVSIINPALSTGIENPLHLAAREGHAGVVRLMMEHESANEAVRLADTNGNTPFHLAALNGRESVVKVLLDSGIDPTLPINTRPVMYRGTPLHYAAAWGHEPVVRLLLQHGINVDLQTIDVTESTPLQWAVENLSSMISWKPLRAEQIITTLLENGADVNYSDTCGRTALHFASTSRYYPQQCKFGEAHSQIRFSSVVLPKRPKKKRDVAKMLHKDIVVLLLKHGADINARDFTGRTPLYWAAEYGEEYCVRNLVELGADVNVQTLDGDTALQMVVRKHWISDAILMAEALLEGGADWGIKDRHGVSAFDVAMGERVPWKRKQLARLVYKKFVGVDSKQGTGGVVSRLLTRVSRGGS